MDSVSRIISDYRERNSARKRIGFVVRYMRMSSRDMANALNEILEPMGRKVTHATIVNWENGVHSPSPYTLNALMNHSDPEDWRVKMATELWNELYE